MQGGPKKQATVFFYKRLLEVTYDDTFPWLSEVLWLLCNWLLMIINELVREMSNMHFSVQLINFCILWLTNVVWANVFWQFLQKV